MATNATLQLPDFQKLLISDKPPRSLPYRAHNGTGGAS
jgi:hypothetical protein